MAERLELAYELTGPIMNYAIYPPIIAAFETNRPDPENYFVALRISEVKGYRLPLMPSEDELLALLDGPRKAEFSCELDGKWYFLFGPPTTSTTLRCMKRQGKYSGREYSITFELALQRKVLRPGFDPYFFDPQLTVSTVKTNTITVHPYLAEEDERARKIYNVVQTYTYARHPGFQAELDVERMKNASAEQLRMAVAGQGPLPYLYDPDYYYIPPPAHTLRLWACTLCKQVKQQSDFPSLLEVGCFECRAGEEQIDDDPKPKAEPAQQRVYHSLPIMEEHVPATNPPLETIQEGSEAEADPPQTSYGCSQQGCQSVQLEDQPMPMVYEVSQPEYQHVAMAYGPSQSAHKPTGAVYGLPQAEYGPPRGACQPMPMAYEYSQAQFQPTTMVYEAWQSDDQTTPMIYESSPSAYQPTGIDYGHPQDPYNPNYPPNGPAGPMAGFQTSWALSRASMPGASTY